MLPACREYLKNGLGTWRRVGVDLGSSGLSLTKVPSKNRLEAVAPSLPFPRSDLTHHLHYFLSLLTGFPSSTLCPLQDTVDMVNQYTERKF